MPELENGYGSFDGLVHAKWLEDGRKMVLLRAITFRSAQDEPWVVPESAFIDGASIPTLFWGPTIGGPFEGKFRDASVIHDYECCVKQRPWKKVHRMFYAAAMARGESMWRAKLMYFAIYVFGPKWQVAGATEEDVPVPIEEYAEEDLKTAAAIIRNQPQIPLEEIEGLTPQRLKILRLGTVDNLMAGDIFVDRAQMRRREKAGPCVE